MGKRRTNRMNSITALGGTVVQRDIAEKVVAFCINQLLPKYRTLDITVSFKKLQESHGAYGFCNIADYYSKNREFILDIDKDILVFDCPVKYKIKNNTGDDLLLMYIDAITREFASLPVTSVE